MERLLNREDVTCIYVCTDSGREGEYIYRLVAQMAQVKGKQEKRAWFLVNDKPKRRDDEKNPAC